MVKVGAFEVEIHSPWPCCIKLTHKGESITFDHRELADLKFAIGRAQQEAMRLLGPDFREEADDPK